MGRAKVCTNTKKGLKKKGYGLLVGMVPARFKENSNHRAQGAPWVRVVSFNLTETMQFISFLVLVHTLTAPMMSLLETK